MHDTWQHVFHQYSCHCCSTFKARPHYGDLIQSQGSALSHTGCNISYKMCGTKSFVLC